MKKVLINESGVFVSGLDVVPDTIPQGYSIVEVQDDNLFLHDGKQYVNGTWQDWDPRTLADYKEERWDHLKTQRDITLDGGFSWNNLVFDSDPKSRANIQGAVTLAQLSEQVNQPFSITWTLKDNSTISLNAQQMKEVGIALANHLNTAYDKGRILRTQVEQALTLEEVGSVLWDQVQQPPVTGTGTLPSYSPGV
jgi:uncharacterized protein YbdZ (MbtH family)